MLPLLSDFQVRQDNYSPSGSQDRPANIFYSTFCGSSQRTSQLYNTGEGSEARGNKNAMKFPTILNMTFSWLGICLVAIVFVLFCFVLLLSRASIDILVNVCLFI